MKRFAFGLIVGIVVLISLPLIVLALGGVNMGASRGPGTLETILASWTVDRSVAVRAPDEKNPHASDATAIADGLHHYREMCVQCHGAPGMKPAEFAAGLNPPAPDLADEAKEWTDGQLFWIIKHGIRMTGMPAFGSTHGDDDIWKIVAFVRQLDHLTAEQKSQLKKADE